MRLTAVMERYVLHWGEMGTRWGVNRSVAQIQALLYLSPQPAKSKRVSGDVGVPAKHHRVVPADARHAANQADRADEAGRTHGQVREVAASRERRQEA